MTISESITLIIGIIGGGGLVGLFGIYREHRSEKNTRKITAIHAQVQNLYGPLQFFTSQNESFFELNKKFNEAYDQEYIDKEWSQSEVTQKNLKEEISQTLNIANSYIDMVTTNNDEILKILKNNYAYIDPDDIEVFRQLLVDYTRLKTEWDNTGRLITPLPIYEYIGDVSFMRPEFIERVKLKFNIKKKELDTLT